jgi:hypothetical protein
MIVSELYEKVRGRLSDTDEPGGGMFTDDKLPPFYQDAYRKLWRAMKNRGMAEVKKTVYYNLPAYQNIITPTHLEVSDFGHPTFIWERGGLTTATVTGASAATPIVLTAAGHPFNTNDEVAVANVGANANGLWFVTYIGSSTFSLNGSTSSASYSPSAGSASSSTEEFREVDPTHFLPDVDPTEYLRVYRWRDKALRFHGSTQIRQLKIEYAANGVPPTSGEIGIDGSEDFLITYTAALAAAAEDMTGYSGELMTLAVGDVRRQAIPGGYLHDFLVGPGKALQRIPWKAKLRLRHRTRRGSRSYY